MKTNLIKAALILAAIAPNPAVCGADGFKTLAKELSRSAKTAGIKRVAVLPFVPADDSSSKDGWTIAEKLMTQVVRAGKVQAVERSLLRNLLDEHQLARTGLLNPATLRKLGQVFAVDALITGSFVSLGGKAVVNARLINVETGVILGAAERSIDREWLADMELASSERGGVFDVQVPDFFVSAPAVPVDRRDMRDAPADDSCIDASERVDQMEGEILELKARYWAAELKKGTSLAGLRVNPGSTITDPALKRKFYERMKYWYGSDSVPRLSSFEVKRFVSVDGKAYSLYRECGV